jgi:glyoxylate reductase
MSELASKQKPLAYQNRLLHADLQGVLDEKFSVLFPDSPDLKARRKDVVAYICAGGPVGREELDRFPALKVIGNHGVGCDHIDLQACRTRGIKVGYTPDVLADATADMGFALLLASARRVREGDIIARDPSTRNFDMHLFGYEVSGTTLGIVGMGKIGIKVAQRALGFNMKVLYNKRRRQEESVEKALSAEYYPALHEMLPKCDYVMLVIPGTKENDKMFSVAEFKAMKKTAVFVNIGRGSVVDQEALVAALTDGTIAAAGVDVTNPEPLPRDHPLLKLQNLTITPHKGSATLNTRRKMVQLVIDNILCGLEGRPLVCEKTV